MCILRGLCLYVPLCVHSADSLGNGQELENELMTVIMAMEDQVKGEVQAAEQAVQDQMPGTMGPADELDESAAGSQALQEAVGPVVVAQSRPQHQRAVAPAASLSCSQVTIACHGSEEMMDRVSEEAASSDTAMRYMEPVERDDDADRQDTSDVLPVALEAALDAAVEESDGPWAAAVSAAMSAAQDEDDEAWHVALEAALEVATAQAVSSNASLFREKVLAASRSKSQSPTCERESSWLCDTEDLLALDNDTAVEGSIVVMSPSNSENVGPQARISIAKAATKGSYAIEQPCHSSPKSTAHTAEDVAPQGESTSADGLASSPASAWLMGINGRAPMSKSSAEADEAACRSVEAEIIRRCIPDASPIDFRRTPRTPTDAGMQSVAVRSVSQYGSMTRDSPSQGVPGVSDKPSVPQQPTRTQRRSAPLTCAAPGPTSCAQVTEQDHVQCADSRTYTSHHLKDLAIRTARSPSESASHQPLSWQISSPAPSVGKSSCGAVVTTPPVTFVNSPRASPHKTSVATPSPRKGAPGFVGDRRLGSSATTGPVNWLASPTTVRRESAFAEARGVSAAAASEAATLPISASSPSPRVEMAQGPPVVPSCGRLPPPHQRQQQLAQVDLEEPSPRVPSLLPGAGQSAAPNLHMRVARKQVGTAPPAPAPLQSCGASCKSAGDQNARSGAGLITESRMQAELTSTNCAEQPLQGQLFLDGLELVVPDPALGLLNCACLRMVSVRPPTADGSAGGDAFVDVCIDCGAVSLR